MKVGTYTALGAMSGELWLFGLAAGAGALASNWLARRVLSGKEVSFRTIVVALVMIWRQRDTLAAFL